MKTHLNEWIEYDSIDLLQENRSGPWYMVLKSEFVWPEFTKEKTFRPQGKHENQSQT